MKTIYMYGHGGCNNHGCEAIVIATIKMLGTDEYRFVLSSLGGEADRRFLPANLVEAVYEDSYTENKLLRKYYGLRRKLFDDREIIARKTYVNFCKSLRKMNRDVVYLSIGGDNYCTADPAWLYYSNRLIDQTGAKRVLWGCSVEPATISRRMIEDLNRYALITVREKVSFDALKEKLTGPQLIYVSDPAFTIPKQPSNIRLQRQTIAINFSPIVTQRGANHEVIQSIDNMLQWILDKTDYDLLFVPHVRIKENDDAQAMKELYAKFQPSGRAMMLEDKYNYAQLRDVISQCRAMICARTHASVSAYAMAVPTLVIGYSVKSIGIARDLFGTDQGYVLPMEELHGKQELVDAFRWMDAHQNEIRQHLKEIMPAYVERAYAGLDALRSL